MSIEKAEIISEAVASKFGLPLEDFSTIQTPEPVTILTSDSGIDLGRTDENYDLSRGWKSLTSCEDDSQFKLEIDGKIIDLRTALTESVAMALYLYKPELKEDLWLTGEKNSFKDSRFGNPYILSSGSGAVFLLRSDEHHEKRMGNESFRFRPTINLGDLSD